MYSWIRPNPYPRGRRHKVVFRNIQGNRKSRTFATADEALTWIAQAQKHLVTDGRAVEDVVAAYLESLAGDRKPSTIATLRYRFQSVVKGANACRCRCSHGCARGRSAWPSGPAPPRSERSPRSKA